MTIHQTDSSRLGAAPVALGPAEARTVEVAMRVTGPLPAGRDERGPTPTPAVAGRPDLGAEGTSPVGQAEPRDLVLVGRAAQLLEQARTVGEIALVIDLAAQAKLWARQAHLGLEAQNAAATIHIDAQAKAGELLHKMVEGGARHPQGRTSEVAAGNFTGPTLTELGVERTEAHRWGQVAAVPPELRAGYISEAVARGEEVSRAGLLSYAAARRAADPRADEIAIVAAEPWVQAGDLLVLGGHRLLVADATDPANLAQLMGGERATLLVTDPPYLIDYTGGNHPSSWLTRPLNKDKTWDTYHDPATGAAFYTAFLAAALPHLAPDGAVYQWHAEKRRGLVEQAWGASGLLLHQILIWRKRRAVLGHSHYQWGHEPCAYGWRQGHEPALRPPAGVSTVWDVEQHGEGDGIHPTQKPVELFRRPIEWQSAPGEIVLDPFAGSGTAIIAAEVTGRRAYGLEILPTYAQGAVERWERLTGKTAVRA